MQMNYADNIIKVVQDACDAGMKIIPEEGILSGFSGNKLTGLLQRFPAVTGGDYLEVGVFQGSSLLSTALANPGVTCYGIDNYTQLDPEKKNKSLVQERAQKLGVSNYELIDIDFEMGLAGFKGEIGTYFIDGPHDYRSQLLCLMLGAKFMVRGGVILVDDANYSHVRQATADFVAVLPEWKLVFESYTRVHPVNMTSAEESDARAGFWNGVHVIAHDPDDLFTGLDTAVPSNQRFINDHLVHGARYAPLAFECTDIAQAMTRPWLMPRALSQLRKGLRQLESPLKGRYRSCNTESEGLPSRTAAVKR